MTAALPAPPPPPPANEEQSPTSSQPTFIEQWLLEERAKYPQRSKREHTEYFFTKQCLFPRYIPQAAMCSVDPILHLISHHVKESDRETSSDATIPEHRTALDDLREVVSLCSTYKSRSLLNRDEFHFKRAMMLKEKQRLEQSADSANGTNLPTKQQSTTSSPTQPPYHVEYTPLALQENFLLAKIHGANYNLCLANAVCPDRTRRLLTCWKSLHPQRVEMMEQGGVEEFICLEERQAVERCIGLAVQRGMKDILG